MKKFLFSCLAVGLSIALLTGGVLLAQKDAPPDEIIKGAYQEILRGADKDADGKLSLAECISISKNKSQMEKDCRYWDADGDGYITEKEYVKQVKGSMR